MNGSPPGEQLLHQMTSSAPPRCPYIGLRSDAALAFTQPIEEHRCHVGRRPQSVSLEHQAAFCLSAGHPACPRFVAPSQPSTVPMGRAVSAMPVSMADLTPVDDKFGRPRRWPVWLGATFARVSPREWLILMGLALFAVGVIGLNLILTRSPARATGTAGAQPTTDLAAARALQVPTPTPASPTPPSATATVAPPTPKPPPPAPTLAPGQQVVLLNPAANSVGWVASGERGAHFGERNLHVGFYDNKTYYGALQFNLAAVPVGARLDYAAVELAGLSAESLKPGGVWALRLLPAEVDTNWPAATYERIHTAPVVDTIPPELSYEALAGQQRNVFILTPAQLLILEQRLSQRRVSFRLDGPTEGENNLFTWDTGYGGGFGNRPVLRLIYQPPPTLTPFVVTNTPVPLNIATVAALVATATHEAATFGTPTPLPPNVVTATPPIIITNTPTPQNAVTAEWVAIEATAQARLYGTPTPLPGSVWTATPIPPTASPTPRPPATLPPPPPTPTPLPLLIPMEQLAPTPTIAATLIPTQTPSALPTALKGKIAFISDRLGKDYLFVVNPDGTQMALLTDAWPYTRALALDQESPDGAHRVFVKNATNTIEKTINQIVVAIPIPSTEIWGLNTVDGWQWPLITGPRITYDPVWSPDGIHIAFVSQEAGNDEIYVVNRHTRNETRLTNNTWEWDKHPSWSPDGQHIVFWTNRENGRKNIWIMNADGSNPRPLIQDESNNWDPVWIK